jgi:hypothetical protein
MTGQSWRGDTAEADVVSDHNMLSSEPESAKGLQRGMSDDTLNDLCVAKCQRVHMN